MGHRTRMAGFLKAEGNPTSRGGTRNKHCCQKVFRVPENNMGGGEGEGEVQREREEGEGMRGQGPETRVCVPCKGPTAVLPLARQGPGWGAPRVKSEVKNHLSAM